MSSSNLKMSGLIVVAKDLGRTLLSHLGNIVPPLLSLFLLPFLFILLASLVYILLGCFWTSFGIRSKHNKLASELSLAQ